MSEKDAVLLSEAQADLKKFASKDDTRTRPTINCIHVTRDYAEATDGHILVRVPHDGISMDKWPETRGTGGSGLNGNSVLLDPKTLDKAFKNVDSKSRLPILHYVHLSLDEKENPVLTATDLETSVNFRQQKVDGQFPDTDQVIPSGRELTFALNAEILSRLANWAKQYGNAIEFYAGGHWGDTILIKIPRGADGPDAIGAISPMKTANCAAPKIKEEEVEDTSFWNGIAGNLMWEALIEFC